MAESLAVKYRPHSWEDVCAQESVIKILTQQINTETFKNCYLFAGASGCGKTTVARIFADAINGGHCNPIEIDAASHNGVEFIRGIIENASERSLENKYKIIILDECHALSNSAWQAFLKCVEEPPKYTIFIFCTTDVQKVPETIKNRCQRFNFGKIKSDIIKERLTYICQKEGFINYTDGVEYLSKLADGGMRYAISLLDKCASYSKEITIDNVQNSLGNFSYAYFFRLLDYIMNHNDAGVLKALDYFYNEGTDLKVFLDQFLVFIVDVNKYLIFKSSDLIKIPSSFNDKLDAIVSIENSNKYLVYYMDKLLELKNMLKNDNFPKSTVEIIFLKICRYLINE